MKAVIGIALHNIAINAQGGTLPEVIDVLPAGKIVEGIDGRMWSNPGNDVLIQKFELNGLELPIDINHACETRGQFGEESPAHGWVHELFETEGVLRGRVKWTSAANSSVGGGLYKYISPAFEVSQNGQQIERLTSFGLVNRPNFTTLAALNNNQQQLNPNGGNMEKILAALGLKAGASEDDALKALNGVKAEVETLRAAKVETNSQQDLVPKADYQLAMNRAEKAEAALANRDKTEFQNALNSALDAAVTAGKIAPASREFYVKTVRNAEDLNEFKTFIAGASAVVTNHQQQAPESIPGNSSALNAEEAEIARQFGYDAETAKAVFKGDK